MATSLTPDPQNANAGTPYGHAMLDESIQRYGLGRGIVADKHGVVIAGNKTLEAAVSAGLLKTRIVKTTGDELVVTQRDDLDLSDPDPKNPARLMAYADNRVSEVALKWDLTQLAADLANGITLAPFFTEEALAALLAATEPKAGRTDPDDVPGERPTDIVAGDLFELGAHRLLCGDSTSVDAVDRVMGGEKADAGFTSPPYNAGAGGFSGGYKNSPLGRTDREPFYKQSIDAKSSDEYVAFLSNALVVAANSLKPNAPLLWNTCYNANSRSEYGRVVFAATNPLVVRETIVWDKGVGMNIATSGILSRTCEFIFLLCREVGYYTNQGPHDTWWNVWRVSNKSGGNQRHGHGASFPVGLADEAIIRFSPQTGLIYEPFSGSGTVIVSCEQHGRRARSVEIDPSYCQVTIDRWEAFTGQKAQKVGEAVRA